MLNFHFLKSKNFFLSIFTTRIQTGRVKIVCKLNMHLVEVFNTYFFFQANATFAHMIKLVTIIHSFADTFPYIENLTTHRLGVAALRNILSSPMFADLKDMFVGNASVPDIDLDQVFNEFNDLQVCPRSLLLLTENEIPSPKRVPCSSCI